MSILRSFQRGGKGKGKGGNTMVTKLNAVLKKKKV